MTQEEIDQLIAEYENDWILYYNQWKSHYSQGIQIEYNPNTMSGNCCGGRGVSLWNDDKVQWECSDCGSVVSNDPSYLGGNKIKDPPYWAQKPTKKCECGADKVYGPGSGMHSATMPCPLYVKV